MICSSYKTAAQTTEILESPRQADIPEENLIHMGDVIDINVVGNYDFDWRGKLNPEGFLSGLDSVEDPIYGLCKSEGDVAAELEKNYSKLLKDPKVNVRIIDRSNRPVAEMLGAVKNQQRFQIRRTVLLNELLILSGGLTERASGVIQIFRPPTLNCAGQKRLQENVVDSRTTETTVIKIAVSDILKGNPQANPRIYNGDLITILTADPIYIIGGVQNPKQIAMRERMTLTQAINSAGGLTKSGRPEDVTIFRQEGTERQVIEVNLSKVKDQQSVDPVLKAFDIVEIGQIGGGKRKYPPVIQEREGVSKNISSLPLRIIE